MTSPGVITKHFDFNDYLEAYRYIKEHGDHNMKVIIKL
jgi:threonine dehydrogenase-like Zn-dependent dehydrogenase